jgi:clan AA aspartic protease (TIGR02281 family)
MSRLVTRIAMSATLLASVCLAGPSFAANPFQDALKQFNQKNYRASTPLFEAALKAGESNPTSLYYCALSNQLSGNRARARQLYEYVSTNFPGSQVAAMSTNALKQWQGSGSSSSSSSSSSGSDSTPAASSGLPISGAATEIRVPCERRNGGIYVEVTLGGQPLRMHLDTGAGQTVIGANHLQAMGLGRPPALQQTRIGGVGDRQDIKGWEQKYDLKVGNAYIKDFPVLVQDHMDGEPLLGQTFLNNFYVTVDQNQVIMRKKTSNTLASTRTNALQVPFTPGPGGHMLVNAEINGKPYVMYFDTGADGISFTQNDLKKLRLELPEGAQEHTVSGVGGTTRSWDFTIDKLKVGPIIKEGLTAHVVEKSSMDHPLLGQTFFGDYEYTIDNEHHVINFKKQR